jgi:UDP-N-acetylglucosamine 2-epimerase (non-hydrolysing)
MKKNLIIFGTRPEAIKMAPLVKEFKKKSEFITKVCVTSQHGEMLNQVLDFFEIIPDFNLNLMKPNQDLHSLTADILIQVKTVLDNYQPDFVYVHGDTTTSMAASIASFYSGIKVCHVEAGLRTYNKDSPFPEEINRQITGCIADFHFTPTKASQLNLINEGVKINKILITGNTVIDALIESAEKIETILNDEIEYLKRLINPTKRIILVTGHRRENHGQGLLDICFALKKIIQDFDSVQIIYPVHLNPNVKNCVYDILENIPNINLIKPLSYASFVWLMKKSFLILTDSGGVQEEAPTLGKPVLLMRDNTERPEAVKAGTVILVGTDSQVIYKNVELLLNDKELYTNMSTIQNLYGDGFASRRIVEYMQLQIQSN